MGIPEQLGELSEVMEGITEGFPIFSPYRSSARMSFLDDTPALYVVCEVKLMLGSAPETWSKAYYVEEFGEEECRFILYDVGHALPRDLALMQMMAKRMADPKVIGDEDHG